MIFWVFNPNQGLMQLLNYIERREENNDIFRNFMNTLLSLSQ